ncbi:MAG TPA: hypothetical protein VLS85_15075 [Hanamia sp.]|nr:hypothetical protein [Hanamia sp.]
MFTKNQILSYLKYAIVAAILYLVCATIFLDQDSYTQIYILYIGNVFFAAVMVFFILNFHNKKDEPKGNIKMIAAGLITTIMGTLISCAIIFILLAILKPSGYAYISHTANELSKPTPSLQGNGHALMFVLFMEAVFGNLGAGAFVSIMLPNTAKISKRGKTSEINPGVNA